MADILPFKKLVEEIEQQQSSPPLKSGGGDGTFTDMDDGRLKAIDTRLNSIESEQRTHFRWTVTIALALGGLVATSSAFLMTRVDRVEDRLTRLEGSVNDLPGRLSTSLNQINQTLFQAISAAKQSPPQVILMPAPSEAKPPESPKVAPQ
ncbi:hypothetical protein LPB73_07375 [Tardiphaga sp. 37S4]|uniref:hypothetical protein n=1 Tax=Tardiphaga sp. 37S4 TaxID=1404741 RepID=UPI001E589C5A|nr:hypothetical protein [Tardiphaga sp. 37S4]UFS77189.1 hypothetical protein LPB73_07375 [Tardiphaga sp. 37S4]